MSSGAHNDLLATATAHRANAAVPLWLAAPEASPAQQRGWERGDEEQSVAAALLRRRLTAPTLHRRAAPPQPLQPRQPAQPALSTLHSSAQQQSAEEEPAVALVAVQPSESVAVSAAVSVSASPSQPLPAPLRRPLPSAALLAFQQQPSAPSSGVDSVQGARSSAQGGSKRGAHSGVDAAVVSADEPFESFDYEAALQSEAAQRAGEQASRRGGGGRQQQRKRSSQSGRDASTQSKQPLEFTRSSRYSGSSRGRQFAAA